MRQLFLITHKENQNTLYVAAETMNRVTEVYTPQKIELVSEKVMVIRDKEPDPYDSKETEMFKEMIQFFKTQTIVSPIKKDELPLQYIERLMRHIIDVECSNRGHQSTFNSMKNEIVYLKKILEDALLCEEKKYDQEEAPGWIVESKMAFK